MDKKELKKNSLDKEYDFTSKIAIGWFTFGTIAFLGFLGVMIINKQYLFAGIFGFLIILISFIFFNNKKKRLEEILEEIQRLK